MKHKISKVTLTCLALVLSLCACKGKHEDQGRQIGKKADQLENDLKKKYEQGKETVHNEKEQIEKKAREAHEQAKEKAHDVINKS